MGAEEISRAYPNGVPAEILDQAEMRSLNRKQAVDRIVEIRDYIRELEYRIQEIEDWLDGKRKDCPTLVLDSDWDAYPNG